MQRIAASLIVLVLAAPGSSSLVSTNVPLGHWSYDAVDKLASYGLIDSAMLTTRPLSRVEMARHIGQAMLALERRTDAPAILESLMDRLAREYEGELMLIGLVEGWYGESFVKPVEDPYIGYVYAENRPDSENVRGDEFREGSNYRAGFATRGKLWERFAFYLHPEYADSARTDGDVDLIEGYGKLRIGPLEIQAGKDSLWWGPGRHGSTVMSNNAQPLTMIKVTTPQPIQLPWIFRLLGLVRTQWFLAELEEDRDVPEAKLSGVRLSIKPHPLVELGASRVVVFGGEGQPGVGFFDYAEMFLAGSEQAENNQLAGGDLSARLPLKYLPGGELLPARSITFYIEGAGEDEAGFLPSNWGYLFGFGIHDILKTGRTDLRIEYANNHVPGKPNVFYNHSVYTSGYTYEGRVLGHHMGTDSSDLFVELTHYLADNVILSLAFDRQTADLSGEPAALDIYEAGVRIFARRDWRLEAAYRYEDASDLDQDDNHIILLGLTRRF